jgi:hypothetical protein
VVSADARSCNGAQISGGRTISVTLDQNGSIPSSPAFFLWPGRDEIENKRAGKRLYCFALLCRLTCSVIRRMRRLMAACSFRASLSVSATTFSVALVRRAVSASSSQRARSSSLGWLRLPRSQAGMVECWAVCCSGAGFMKNITAQLRCHTKGLRLIPRTYFQSTCSQGGAFAGSEGSYYLFFLATFHFAHRARCAAAIRFRPAADILRLGRLPRERLKPLRTEDCVIKRVQLRLKPATLSLQITYRFGQIGHNSSGES